MIAFFINRRKLLLLSLFAFLLIGCVLGSYLYAAFHASYQLIPDGLPFPIQGGYASFREPYHDSSSVNMAPYSPEYSFLPDSYFARLRITDVRLLEINTHSIYDNPYLIVEALPEKFFPESDHEAFSADTPIRLCIAYFPGDCSLAGMLPKIEKDRSYYINFTALTPSVNPPPEAYLILEKLGTYSASSSIFSIIPVNDDGNVILSQAMKKDLETPGTQVSPDSLSFELDQSLSAEVFESMYQSAIKYYCPDRADSE